MKGKKTGGRSAGVPNRKTQSLIQMCEDMNFCPFEAMLTIAKDSEHKDSAMMLKEVATYLYPKRKSLEHSGSLDPKMMEAAERVASMSKEEQIALLEAELKELKG